MSEWKMVPETLLDHCMAALDVGESGDAPTYTDCPIHGRHEGDCPRC